MRTREKHEETRQALVQKTWNLFLEKGYEKCTMAVILRYLDISKGEFYHYFRSKEECAKACASYYASQCVKKISESSAKDIPPFKQLGLLFQKGADIASGEELQMMDSATNRVFHQMVMVELVKMLAPVYSEVFERGNQAGEWKIAMPVETAEIFLTLTQFYLDDSLFGWDEEQTSKKVTACLLFLAKILDKKDSEVQQLI